jgi:hypothetical protein
MTSYEYELLKMEPVATDADRVEELLNEKGAEGFRLIAIQKLWTSDDYGQSIQRNFLVLEKAEEEEL